MNTPRAVLCSPHTSALSHLRNLSHTYKILIASILLTSHEPIQAKETESIQIQQTIQGEDLSQMFEGFTAKLKFDPEQSTWNIGYGTDIGQKKSTWPYGTFAEDVATLMEQEGLSRETIHSIFVGDTLISPELGKKLFDLRYDTRKTMLSARYEAFFQKKFTDLPPVVQNMLVDFSYNMRGEYGIFPSPGFVGFPQACEALKRQDWAALAHEIAESRYADQVGPRRAGYWVAQLVNISDKPLKSMTTDVQEEVSDFKQVQKEIEIRLAHIMRQKRGHAG